MTDLEVYLSGEIHTDWRAEIEEAVKAAGRPINFTAPVTVHENSDDCGVSMRGTEEKPFWADHKGAKDNAIRTRTLIERADSGDVRFTDK